MALTRARYHASAIQGGRLLLQPAPGVDARELKAYGGVWVKAQRCWSIVARLQDVRLLEEDGIKIDVPDPIAEALGAYDELDSYLHTAQTFTRAPEHPSWATLMGHQRVGVAYLASRDRGLLALTPGLGKTATAVVAADLKGMQRILVVAPLTLAATWRTQIRQWTSDAEPTISADVSDEARWTITNPERMFERRTKGSDEGHKQPDKLLEAYAKGGWDLVILDESVLYKNRNARRTAAMAALAKRVPVVWLLSGLPVTRYADDLYAQLNIMRPDAFSSYWRFAAQWCQLEQSPWGTKVVGNRAPARLKAYLSDLMLSRTPEEVEGLPDALFELINVELSDYQLKQIERLKDTGMVKVGDEDQVCDNVLAQLTRSAQLLSYPGQLTGKQLGSKLTTLREMLGWVALPAIVWTQFKATAEAARKIAETAGLSAAVITGDVSKWEREEILDRFQRGDLEVLVIQLQTGKFGLSLTEAKCAIFVDRSYSSDDWTQAVARVRRLSSTAPVPNYVLHAGSVDNLIDLILNRKLRSINDLSLSDLGQYL